MHMYKEQQDVFLKRKKTPLKIVVVHQVMMMSSISAVSCVNNPFNVPLKPIIMHSQVVFIHTKITRRLHDNVENSPLGCCSLWHATVCFQRSRLAVII